MRAILILGSIVVVGAANFSRASTGDVGSVGVSGVDLGDCAANMQLDLNMAGITGDYVGVIPFEVRGNKVAVKDASLVVSREKINGQDVFKYKVPIGNDAYEVRTLQIIRESDGSFTLRRKDDLDAQKKAYGGNSGLVRSGAESKYLSKDGRCQMTQASSLMSLDGKDMMKQVYVDKKYCDSIAESLKSEGKSKTIQCVNMLDKAQKIYADRRDELTREGKVFAAQEDGFIGAAMKVAMCSPKEWDIRLKSLGFKLPRYDDDPINFGTQSSGKDSKESKAVK